MKIVENTTLFYMRILGSKNAPAEWLGHARAKFASCGVTSYPL